MSVVELFEQFISWTSLDEEEGVGDMEEVAEGFSPDGPIVDW